MSRDKIRVGLLINRYSVPAWVYQMIWKIHNSEHSEVVLVVVRKQNGGTSKEGLLSKKWSNSGSLLFRLFRKVDRRKYTVKPNAFEVKELDFLECDELEVTPKETKFSDRIHPNDIEKIKAYDIDVFIRLGFKILRGDILNVSKYGVWSYHHGDNDVNRGGPAGTWEALQYWKETGATLQVLTEDLDGGITLAKTTVQTNKLSVIRNKNLLYWKASLMLPRKLEELFKLGPNAFFANVERDNSAPYFYYNRLFTTPTNLEMIPFIVNRIWSVYWRKIKKKFIQEQWILLFAINKRAGLSKSFYRFKRLQPPKDRIWADPFVIFRENKYYIFIEELIFSKVKKGHISVIEMDEAGNYSLPEKILEKDYHLSYPFVFEDNGQLYMIPETAQNKSVDLYKCTGFPVEWTLEETLMNNIEAVDSTLFKHNGTYYLFTNVKELPGTSTLDELSLFYSDDLLGGQWISHPCNPIISDVKFARSAGKIFVHENRIFRPAQNNSDHYGAGMQIREIITLNKQEYKEKQIQSIYPNWAKDIKSTHTLNAAHNLTIIDALVTRRRF